MSSSFRQQWSLLNLFRTEQGHCGAYRRKWRIADTDLCPCCETQIMSHVVESCPLTKLNGGLSRLHSADEDAVSWLTNYSSWHAYEKKKTGRSTGSGFDLAWLSSLSSEHLCVLVFMAQYLKYFVTFFTLPLSKLNLVGYALDLLD